MQHGEPEMFGGHWPKPTKGWPDLGQRCRETGPEPSVEASPRPWLKPREWLHSARDSGQERGGRWRWKVLLILEVL